jgi:hypothetical protein
VIDHGYLPTPEFVRYAFRPCGRNTSHAGRPNDVADASGGARQLKKLQLNAVHAPGRLDYAWAFDREIATPQAAPAIHNQIKLLHSVQPVVVRTAIC